MRRSIGRLGVPTVLLALAGLVGACTGAGQGPVGTADRHGTVTATSHPASEPQGSGSPRVVRTVADHLEVPWGLAFLPDGSALVTERDSGRVLAVASGAVREVGRVSEAAPQGEAGLLGVAVSPTYAEDLAVFLYVTTETDNRVVRTTYDGARLGDLTVILDGIPNGFIHDGGRLAFGPDGLLYVSTGETGDGPLAQDPDSLGGKILRITMDGDPAPGNPDPSSPVFSLGHRNVQGLAFDDRGRLWASEFGASTWDELNLVKAGANYGWPLVEGRGELPGYRNPFAQWHTDEASPSGLAYREGTLWLASLRGQRLWQVPLRGNGVAEPVDWFVGRYGRLRTVALAPDGHLWLTTSNRDGRGSPVSADDRILELAVD